VAPKFGESFALSFVAIVKAPTIRKVEGCINKYHPDSNIGAFRGPRGHGVREG
jgi:hypothetical protein